MKIGPSNITTQGLLRTLRRNIHLYIFVRRFAVVLSKYFFLEEGFAFLKNISHDPEAVALDIGSNDGTSIALIRKAKPNSYIHSFDPVHKIHERIYNHKFHNLGLSSKIGTLDFFVPTVTGYELTQYASTHKEKVIDRIYKDFGKDVIDISFRKVTSEVSTVDLLKLKPFFIKVDVEGHELEVLKGASETIRIFKPILLLEIQDFTQYEELRDFLSTFSYSLCKWPKHAHIANFQFAFQYSDGQTNYVWISKESSKTWKFSDL